MRSFAESLVTSTGAALGVGADSVLAAGLGSALGLGAALGVAFTTLLEPGPPKP